MKVPRRLVLSLMMLLVACSPTPRPAPPPMVSTPSPDALKAIKADQDARMQVYVLCTIQAVKQLDDYKSDPATIALAVMAQCSSELEDSIRASCSQPPFVQPFIVCKQNLRNGIKNDPGAIIRAVLIHRQSSDVRPAADAMATSLKDANAAFGRGDYATAVQLLRPLAMQGNPLAQTSLGFMYDQGNGVPQDYTEAVKWFRKAADQGNPNAQVLLAAEYARGKGVPQDFAQAAKWDRKAADQGDADAQSTLGLMYALGQGVPKSEAEAILWYRKAADQGNADAQYNLANRYFAGEGVPQDYVQALKWFDLAIARLGASDARDMRDFAIKYREQTLAKMNPAQIAEAQRLVREWKPTRSGE